MTPIIVFNDSEKELLYYFIEIIDKKKPGPSREIHQRLSSLNQLAENISQYPPITHDRKLGHSQFTLNSLKELVWDMEFTDQTMYVPTKAVLGKSFLIAKINFLFMLKYTGDGIIRLKMKMSQLDEMISLYIFSLMSEEVYLTLLHDKELDGHIRNRASLNLIDIWEYRLNQTAQDFAPILSSMWTARKKTTPIYGTLLGISEITMMSKYIDPVWFDFLSEFEGSDLVFQSLEEFLFNLTFEEIGRIREEMKTQQISVVEKKRVAAILGSDSFYTNFNKADPREMFRFFKQRSLNAEYRRRSSCPGPQKTLEEYLLAYLLHRDIKKEMLPE